MVVFLVLPTYRRDSQLDQVLTAIRQQTEPPRAVFVVDNASSNSCALLVARHAEQAPVSDITYIDAGDNTGPAGGTAIGMLAALELARDDDWLMRCDDDQAPPNDRFFQDRLGVAEDCIARDPQTGAVGSSGARYDRSRARLVKPPRDPDSTYISVDYLATGYFPLYRAGAVRHVGAFRRDFFFGYTEVEYGLRMKQFGYKLYRFDAPEGAEWDSPKRRIALRPVTWQQYYSLRNHLVLASEYSGRRACVRIAATALAKPALNFPRYPCRAGQALYWNTLAIAHATRGRLGRTVDPWLVDGTLTPRFARK